MGLGCLGLSSGLSPIDQSTLSVCSSCSSSFHEAFTLELDECGIDNDAKGGRRVLANVSVYSNQPSTPHLLFQNKHTPPAPGGGESLASSQPLWLNCICYSLHHVAGTLFWLMFPAATAVLDTTIKRLVMPLHGNPPPLQKPLARVSGSCKRCTC